MTLRVFSFCRRMLRPPGQGTPPPGSDPRPGGWPLYISPARPNFLYKKGFLFYFRVLSPVHRLRGSYLVSHSLRKNPPKGIAGPDRHQAIPMIQYHIDIIVFLFRLICCVVSTQVFPPVDFPVVLSCLRLLAPICRSTGRGNAQASARTGRRAGWF